MYGEFFNFCVSIKDVHYYVTSLGNGKWILYYKCHYYPLECVSSFAHAERVRDVLDDGGVEPWRRRWST
jgi:hypothetical protein